MDEAELLTIYDSHGHPLGTKPRAHVHRDGDWHVVVFVLAARLDPNGSKRLLLQLRSGVDDPYKGQVDVLAAGHVLAAESPKEAALRELHEETGLQLEDGDLVELGEGRLENPSDSGKKVIQKFYLCRRPVSLEQVSFSPEVNGFLEVDLDEFTEFIAGKRRTITAYARVASGGNDPHRMEITRDFIAAYSALVLDSFRRCLAGVRRYLETGKIDPRLRI